MMTQKRLKFSLLAMLCLLMFSFTGNAQTTIFQFDFEAGTTVSTDNAVGTPSFTQVGTVGVTTGACVGTAGRNASGWDANDALRFTVNTTGFSGMNFSYQERTSNTNISTFLVRVSTDLTNWTTIRTSYTPPTACGGSGNLSVPAAFNNQSTVYIEIFKNVNAGAGTTTFRVDNVTLTGSPLCPTITPTISQVDVLCNGASTGSITVLSISGGASPYTYSNNDGSSYQSSNLFTALAANTYQVKVKDANACESSASAITITQPSTAPSFTFSQSNVTTFGGSDGSITVSASGGTTGYTYSSDNGSTYQPSNIFSGLAAGTYQVKVKDGNGCETAAQAVNITQPLSANLAATFTATNITCNGLTNGQIQFTVSGGITPYVLAITGPVNSTQNLASAGTYTFTGLPTGSYLCEVLDNNLDIVSDTRIITEPAAFSFTTSKTDVNCFGVNIGTITVNGASGGTGALQYSIDNGTSYQVANSFTSLAPGTYQVKIKDASGCESIAQAVTITGPSAGIAYSTAKTDVTCFNGSNGTITVNSVTGGTLPYLYSSNNGGLYVSSNLFSGLTAGTYQIKVRDVLGCETNATAVTITQPASAVTFTSTATNVSCFGAANGTISISATGGSGAGYQYSNDNGSNYQPSNSFTGLGAGNYALLVKDGSNCESAPSSATITQPTDIILTNINTNVSCNGGANGAIDLSVTGGAPCQNGAGLVISEILPDASGTDDDKEYIEVIATRDINFASTPYTVIIANNGSAANNGWIAGGALTYAFEINTGTAVAGGVYYVGGANMAPTSNRLRTKALGQAGDGGIGSAITSSGIFGNGGTADGVAIFASPVASITASTVPVDAVFYGTTYGGAIPAGGNTQGYQLPVNDLYNGGKFDNGVYLAPFANTNYITSASRVFNSSTGTFNSPRSFTNTTSVTNGTSGLSAINSGPQYTYSWSNGATAQDLSLLPAGTFNVTVTNCTGCTKQGSFNITEPAVLTADAVASNATCFGDVNGSVDLTVTGGTGPYTFAWSNGASTEDLAAVGSGTYSVTVTDNNGCTTSTSTTVNQPAAITIISSTVNDASCFGGSDGSIILFANGGNSMLDYLWSNGGNVNQINSLSVGAYSVTLTDNLGCSATATYTVGQSAPIVVNTTATDVSCFNGTNGAIDATVSGGIAPYFYSWSNGAVTEDVTNLTFGFYVVTVTDDYGCTVTKQTLVDEPAQLTLAAGNGGPYTAGQTANFTSTPSGGTSPYSFQWSEIINGSLSSPLDQNPSITNAQLIHTGNYGVVVTDNNGCTASAATSLTVNPSGPITAVTWTGLVSGDWHTAANWSPAVVPSALINVTIPAGTANVPTISTANAAVKNITYTGTGLALTSVQGPYQLSVKGNWVGNTNTVVLGAGIVVFDQPGATIAGTNFISVVRINTNTTILSAANLTITNELQINGGTLNTSNKLTIRSNAAGTARIAPILSGSINGKVTQERYIGPGPLAYEYLASAVSGQTIGHMNDDIGIRVGAGGSVQWYNETLPGNMTTNGWTVFTALANPIPAHRGVATYMYARPKTVDFTGFAYTGFQNIPVTYTSSGSPTDDGYNLVANPYLSAIDWDAPTGWTRTNIDPTIYILNPATNNNVSYNHITNIGTGGFNGKIASGQSFFVQAIATSPVLSVTEDVKTTGAVFYKNDEQVSTYLRMHVKGENGNGDEMILGFADNATTDFDRALDAAKINSGYVDMALVAAKGQKLTQQFIDADVESAVLPVAFNTNNEMGNFTISFENVSSVNKQVYLRDNLTGTITEVTNAGAYNFTIDNSNIDQAETRFDILIGKQENKAGDMFDLVVYPNPASSKFNVVLGNNATATNIQVFDLVGKLVYTNNTLSANHIEVDANDFESGTYMIQVTANGVKQTQRVVINK